MLSEYSSGLELDSIRLISNFQTIQKPAFLFCILRNGSIYVENSEVCIHTSCFLPLYPLADIPIVLVYHPNHSVLPNELFIHFRLPLDDVRSCRIRGVVGRKALSVLSDGSYLFSLSVKNCKREVIVRANKNQAQYCQLYLPIGTEIMLSDYSASCCFSIMLKYRSLLLELTSSSMIVLEATSIIPISNKFPLPSVDIPFLFIEREAKKLSHWKGIVLQRISPTLYLLNDSVYVMSLISLSFQPSDRVLFFNIHMIYRCDDCVKLICVCSSSSVLFLFFSLFCSLLFWKVKKSTFHLLQHPVLKIFLKTSFSIILSNVDF